MSAVDIMQSLVGVCLYFDLNINSVKEAWGHSQITSRYKRGGGVSDNLAVISNLA